MTRESEGLSTFRRRRVVLVPSAKSFLRGVVRARMRAFESCGANMLKHNTYFDGQVQSVGFERNGSRATVGVIAPGEYRFDTAAAERMTVVSGTLDAKLPGGQWLAFPAGASFEVPADSSFEVRAIDGAVAYLCEFLS